MESPFLQWLLALLSSNSWENLFYPETLDTVSHFILLILFLKLYLPRPMHDESERGTNFSFF